VSLVPASFVGLQVHQAEENPVSVQCFTRGTLGSKQELTPGFPRQNANGDVVALIKGASPNAGAVLERYAYEPYGSVVVMDGAGVVRPGGTAHAWRTLFQGGRLDAVSGLYNFQRRDYDPSSGVWMERDPSGLGGGDPNLYRFVGNNPVNWIDPSGLAGEGVAAAAGLGVLQGCANTVNGVQDVGVGVLNTPAAVWNWTGGWFLPNCPYIPSPDWSKGLITEEDPFLHDTSKFLGGTGVSMLVPAVLKPLRAPRGAKCGPVEPPPAPANPAAPACPAPTTVNPGSYLGGKAPNQVTPGVRVLEGQYVDDLGRIQPWRAHYDQYGRQIARTDSNAGIRAQGIPDTHHHIYEYNARFPHGHEIQSHIPGEYHP